MGKLHSRNSDGILSPLPKMHGHCKCEVKPRLTKTISRWLKTTLGTGDFLPENWSKETDGLMDSTSEGFLFMQDLCILPSLNEYFLSQNQSCDVD